MTLELLGALASVIGLVWALFIGRRMLLHILQTAARRCSAVFFPNGHGGFRQRLLEEVLTYLGAVAQRCAQLPAYYPEHLRRNHSQQHPFDHLYQELQLLERANRTHSPSSISPRPQPWRKLATEQLKYAVILGEPGAGKTWLLRYEARRLALASLKLLREYPRDLEKAILPIFISLPHLRAGYASFEKIVLRAAREAFLESGSSSSASFSLFVREKLKTDRCVLLVDAWDEVPAEAASVTALPPYGVHLRQRIAVLLRRFIRRFPGPRVVLTSRTFGYIGSPIPGAREFRLLHLNRAHIKSAADSWFGHDTGMARRFISTLRQYDQLSGLAGIPLMLTLMCRNYGECREEVPFRRAQLCHICLRGLLRDWKEEKQQSEISDAYVEALLELLREIAYQLFPHGYRFTEALLRRKMLLWLRELGQEHELSRSDPASLITQLKVDGVLVREEGGRNAPLRFLHATFHEHLTKEWLSRGLHVHHTFSDAVFTKKGVVILDARLFENDPGAVLAVEEYLEQVGTRLEVPLEEAGREASVRLVWYDPRAGSAEDARRRLTALSQGIRAFTLQHFGKDGERVFRFDPNWFSQIVFGEPESVPKQVQELP